MSVVKTWNVTALTGGGARALDAIPSASIAHGHREIGIVARKLYIHEFDATATDAESSPDVIRPDDYTTAGVWLLVTSPFDISAIGTVPAGLEMSEGIIGGDASHGTDAVNDLDFAPILCMDSTNGSAIYSATTLIKQLDAAWAVGNAGGLLNGSKAINTVYKWYALLKDSDQSVDFGFLALADAIGSYLPAGYSKYRFLGFRHTNAAGAWAGFTQNGDYINGWTASENILSTGITTSYAVVDHTVLIDTSHIELIEYGVRDATLGANITASDDGGTNASFFIGRTSSSINDADANIWGSSAYGKAGLKPYSATRKFNTSSGTLDLLCQAIKFKR